ncbi:MAG: hypothetical protein IJ648_04180 [Lachnospiraceae bacterium]|nr:hypothetical protein [Lachnospiraceae bacterium]
MKKGILEVQHSMHSHYKKWLSLGLGISLLCAMTGCGSTEGTQSRTATTENAIAAAINDRGTEEAQNNGGSNDSISDDSLIKDNGDQSDSSVNANTGSDTANTDADDSSASDDAAAELKSSTPGIDVDLTILSSTMIYSEVYNMMAVPDDYIGKTIKMEGAYSFFEDETTGKQYYACIIQDATACCAQGIEFVPTADFAYPEDFPQEGEDVTVVGTFSLYEENGFQYATLLDAEML